MLLRCDVELLACGQVALEDDLIRVYDVFTSPAQRSRGLASLLCRHMLCQAREQGAQTACLQVDADNASGRAASINSAAFATSTPTATARSTSPWSDGAAHHTGHCVSLNAVVSTPRIRGTLSRGEDRSHAMRLIRLQW